MEFTLPYLRVLLAVIFLIAGSTLASTAPCLSGGALGASVESGVSRDRLAVPEAGLAVEVSDHDGGQNGCMDDCRMKCVGSTASGCCGAAIPIAGGNALDRASIAACGITDTGFLATGLVPDALLRPPRSQV
jgi:hypothetical protein